MKIAPKRKILIIPSWYMTTQQPVAGSFFQEQAQLLSRNFDIKVLFGQAKEVSKTDFYLAKIKMKLNLFKVELLPHQVLSPEAFTFFYPQNKEVNEEKNAFMMFQCYWEAFKQLAIQWQPDLLHAQCIRYGGMICNYICKLTQIPYLITEHASASFWLEGFNPLKNELMAEAYEKASMVVSVSHGKMREILTIGYLCKHIVVGNLVNENIYTIHKKSEDTKSFFQLLIVANNAPQKDLETLFLAFNYIITMGENNIKLTIIGVKPEKEMSSLLKEYLMPYINFIPSVSRQDMPTYYQQKCDLLLSTSIDESFGLSVAEAIMCGKPVVVTRSGGIDDIVDSTNGLKVHIRDWKSLAEAILKIKNKEIIFDAETMRQGMIEKFGTEAFLNKMTEVYLSAMNTKS
jgi:glycosyltransferase involved in cell wall biosynthesis